MGVILMILKIIGGIILSLITLIILALFVRIRVIADYGEEKSVAIKWLFLNIPVFPMNKKEKKNKNNQDTDNASEQPADQEQQNEPASPQQPAKQPATYNQSATENQPVDEPVDKTVAAKKDTAEKPNILNLFMDSNGGVDGLILLIKEIFSYIGSFFGGIFRAFVIDELMVDMTVTKNDAAETAIYYGQLCSSVFPMLGTFVTKYKVKQYDFNIQPDFIAKKSSAEMHIVFGFRPAKLIGVVLLLVARLVFKVGFKAAFRMIKPMLQSRKKENNKVNNNTEESGVSNE